MLCQLLESFIDPDRGSLAVTDYDNFMVTLKDESVPLSEVLEALGISIPEVKAEGQAMKRSVKQAILQCYASPSVVLDISRILKFYYVAYVSTCTANTFPNEYTNVFP